MPLDIIFCIWFKYIYTFSLKVSKTLVGITVNVTSNSLIIKLYHTLYHPQIFSYLSRALLCTAGSWNRHTHTSSPTPCRNHYCGTRTGHTHSLHCRCRPLCLARCRRPARWGCSPPLHTHTWDPIVPGCTGRSRTRRCRFRCDRWDCQALP